MAISNIALVFPGQGSQHIGMGKDVVKTFSEAASALEEASDTLKISMSELIFGDDEKKINLTENTQPAILTISIAILRVLQKEFDINPLCVSGHSLGEYSANVYAESLSYSNSLSSTRKRGIFMQQSCPVGFGKMAAVIGLDNTTIKSSLESLNVLKAHPSVFVANFNSSIQTVISGETDAVEEACAILKEKGAKKIVELPVSAPFHTPFMEKAKENLSDFMKDEWFKDAKCDIFSNATALNYSTKEDVKKLLLEQIVSPVLWEDIIINMKKFFEVSVFVEIGPSNVLSSLIKRIDKNAAVISVNSVQSIKDFGKFISENVRM